MKKIIVLTSVTYALKAQEILRSHGIKSKLTRSSAVRKVRGCGYGIIIDAEDLQESEKLISEAGIKNLGSVSDR